MLVFHSLLNQTKHGVSERNSCLQESHARFLFDSRTIICVCQESRDAASLKFLKQEGLWAELSMARVKLPGYRGNGLEGRFKGTVLQHLLQCIQMFPPVRYSSIWPSSQPRRKEYISSIVLWIGLEYDKIHLMHSTNSAESQLRSAVTFPLLRKKNNKKTNVYIPIAL